MKKTLNLGCGERTFEEYPEGYKCINLDNRTTLKDIDIICDVKDLSTFSNDEFDYILASDIIEHFPLQHTVSILTDWKRVLKSDGILEIRTPNLHYWCKHYVENHNAEFVSHHLFGGQEYDGNFHYVCFDNQWLTAICKNIGLERFSYEEEHGNMVLKLNKGV